MSDSPENLFTRWVLAVVPKLRELPDGDGAFAGLSMAFGLYERFIDSKLHKEKTKASAANFYKAASDDFGLGEPGITAIDRMWNGFRLGMQHAFQPKAYIENKGSGDRWGWNIAENMGYHAYPEIIKLEKNLFIVTLDPWLFIEHTLQRWRENPDLMNELPEFQLGKIAKADNIPPQPPVDSSHSPPQSNQIGNATQARPSTMGTYLPT